MFKSYKFPHGKQAMFTILTFGLGFIFWIGHYFLSFASGKREVFYEFPHLMHIFGTILTFGLWAIVWFLHYSVINSHFFNGSRISLE